MLPSRRAFRAAFAGLCLLSAAAAVSAQANSLLITQVYGGGGSTSTNPTPSYKNDFIEIFNAGTTAMDLSTYSLQYGPAGSTASPSTSFTGITVLSSTALSGGKLAPGQYFLVQEASATNATGATLSGVDQTGTISMAAASAKVALVNGTTLLSATGSCSSTTIVSLVGYGTLGSNTCAEGGAPTASPSTTTSALRTVSCTDSGSNAADFTVGPTMAPRNSTTTLAPCSGSTAPLTALSISGATATPAAVMQGGSTTLSVTVAPGSNSTGITVTADLSSIGGSATQALALSGTANTYTYALAVPASAAASSYSFPVTARDQQSGVANGSIALTVNAATVTTPISTIQSNRATYVGTTLQTQGVVTAVTSSGYYMQTASSTPGSTGDEGIYVYTGSTAKSAAVVVGNLITINGTLTLYPAATASHTPSLEMTSASVTLNGTATIPAAIALPSGFPTAGGGIYQFQKYESMLVKVPSLTAVSPTDGSLTETTETVTSSGQFYAVATGTAKPFREPGMDFRDYPTSTCATLTNCTATATSAGVARPANVVLYDDNPERFIVETSLAGGTAVDVSSGAVLTNVTGVVDFTYSTDVPYGDPARILLLPGQVTAANLTAGVTVQALTVPSSSQVTVGAFNIERFFNTSAADNKYFNAGTGNVANSSAVNVTADAYARRLKKVSLAIRNVLNAPDVIAFEEAENKSVLQDIATQIDTDAVAAGKTAPGYVPYGTDSTTTYTDDVGGISVGFLVKPATVNVIRWEQIGASTTFAASTGTQTLNDRPSQVLHVGFKRANGASDYLMTLIVNHLRSLSGINTSADTRLKKELQAEMLANAIQGYQAAGERVLAMGDMNAFEFSDGYTDTLGTITGRVAATGTAAQPGMALVNPVATDLVTLLPSTDRRSYVEFGNAQVLDHIVASSNVVANTSLAYAHLNADFPVVLTNDATTPARTSDHDAALAYLSVPAPVVSGTLTGSGVFATATTVGSTSAGQQIVFTNTGEAPIAITSVAIGSPTPTADFAQTNNCGTSLAVGSTCQINVVFKPTAAGTRTGTLTVLASNGLFNAVTLTGTGLVPPTFTLTASGSSSYSTTVQRGYASQIGLTVTPTATFIGTVTFSCTGLPSNVSCDFTPTSLTLAANSAAQSVTLLVRTATLNAGVRDLQRATAPRLAFAFWLPGLLLAGMGVRSRRAHGSSRMLLVCFLLLGCAGMAGLTGCSSHGGSTFTNTTAAAAGTYTFNVVATSPTVTQTLPVTITIQ